MCLCLLMPALHNFLRQADVVFSCGAVVISKDSIVFSVLKFIWLIM